MSSDAREPNHEPEGATLALLHAARSGDGGAISALLLRDLAWVRQEVHRRLGGVVRLQADTNDVVQELFLRVLRSGPKLQVDDRAQFRRLMARIVQCTLVSMARKYSCASRAAGAGAETVSRQVDPSAPSPATAAATGEDIERVQLALELMAPLDREVLHLRDLESLPFAAIGARLGFAEDAVRMRYRRALGKLRDSVELLRVRALEALLAEDSVDEE